MLVTGKHKFVSNVPNDGISSRVQPTIWNDEHTFISHARADIPALLSTSIPSTFAVCGNTAMGDLGAGAVYTSVGAGPSGPRAIQSSDGVWYNLVPVNGIVNMGHWGVVGDSTTDDAPVINTASAYAQTAGLTKIVFPAGKKYRISSAHLKMRNNMVWDGQGSWFLSNIGFPTMPLGIFANDADSTKVAIGDVTGDVVGPTNQLTLTSVVGLNVGDYVGILLGVDPYTLVDIKYALLARVTAIVVNTITIDQIIPITVPITPYSYIPKAPPYTPIAVAAAAAGNKTVYKMNPNDVAVNLIFKDMIVANIDGTGTVEAGFGPQWGANMVFDNIRGNPNDFGEMGAGLFVFLYCRDIVINDPYLGSCSNPSLQASKGRFISIGACQNVKVNNHISKNLQGGVAFIEASSHNVVFDSPTDFNNVATISSNYTAYQVATDSQLILNNPTIFNTATSAKFAQYYGNGSTDGDMRIYGTFTWRGPLPLGVTGAVNKLRCLFDYQESGVGFALIDFSADYRVQLKVPLTASMVGVQYELPGYPIELDTFMSNGVPGGSLSFFYIAGVDVGPQFQLGKKSNVGYNVFTEGLGINYGGITRWTTVPVDVFVYTNATAQPDGSFIGVAARCARILESNLGSGGISASFALVDEQMNEFLTGSLSQNQQAGVLVGSLPAASAANKGYTRMVTDATVTTFWTIVAGGGGNTVPVTSDGTNWRIG